MKIQEAKDFLADLYKEGLYVYNPCANVHPVRVVESSKSIVSIDPDNPNKNILRYCSKYVCQFKTAQEFCKDVAMHIAATAPLSVNLEDIDTETIESEKNIFREQSKKSGKPEEIIEKMIDGRMKKFYQENVLMEQSFVKNPDLSINDLLTETIAKLGENITISRFSRYQLGEKISSSEASD